ncbi:MAG TPA: NAD-dependent epimerase/dehydratase family protein [Candidatus Limnocylindrales bacterium]|nr:NAD-dependent epimerase/dehydratase family protein [Candidatus Limnocylindrales bacterium]
MKALVTGVAGFIGSTLAEQLVAGGHDVVGIDCFLDYYPRELKERNLSGLSKNPRFRFVEESLVDADLGSLVSGVDWVFHQAAQAGVRSSWGEDFRIYSDNNVYATQRLLEACRGGALRKFVYASSSSIYGDTDDLPMRETSIPKPVSPYGVSKLAAEHLVWLYSKNFGLPTVSLRYFTVYGPRQRPDMAFHRFIRAAIEDKPIVLYGDGEQSRDFTFVADIVQANVSAAESEATGTVYNLGGGSRTTVNEVIDTIGRLVGRTVRVDRRETQKGDVRHTAADTSAARREIAFAPKVTLDEGLERQVAWQKSL